MVVYPFFIVIGLGFLDALIALDQLPPTDIPAHPPAVYQSCDTHEPAAGVLLGAALCDPPATAR